MTTRTVGPRQVHAYFSINGELMEHPDDERRPATVTFRAYARLKRVANGSSEPAPEFDYECVGSPEGNPS